MLKLILLRHGQSLWNRDNRFTGWTDVGLTPEGEAEARAAARLMRRHDLTFDLCFSSCLRRAIKTLWLVLEEMELMWLPVDLSWRLNERHYGALQGLNKEEMAARVGEEQVRLWRRSYDVRPPALSPEDERWAGRDRRYAGLRQQEIPGTESLKDTVERVLPYWHGRIVPELKAGRRVLVCAHGNSLRGLVKYLEQIPDQEIPALEIPTGQPLLYELDAGLQVRRRYYLHEAGAAG